MKNTRTHTINKSFTNRFLIDALRETSKRLDQEDVQYQWGHMGQCNAGHLIQTLTGMSSLEIVESVDFQLDEWSEHAIDYCSCTGNKVDDIFLFIEKHGLSHSDIVQLENLSDRKVLGNLNGGFRYLERNRREHVVEYMLSFADLLESS
ncbi:hypothetical protein [Candidatus Seribacter sulfatis]|jgi:hypothetical protein|uniref:hypothetical protein n=1 Tax=Candidatus Seribacter sulfatis TaxID=3381756 RepID=UPI0031BE5F30|nr:hypothetical protein [Opitutales bacterium]